MKKDKGFSYAELNGEELEKRLDKTEQDLFKLRFRAATAPLKNPMQIQSLRREVARLQTFILQRRAKG